MSHTPKHAMLIALSEGLLSEAGTRRAMRHLEQCAVCRHAHSGHRQRVELLEFARATTAPAVDYDRMSLALRQVARTEATRHSRRTLVSALAIAAALALVVFGGSRLLTESPVTEGPVSPSAANPSATDASATPTNTAASNTNIASQQGGSDRIASAAATANDTNQHIPIGSSDVTNGDLVLDEGMVLHAEADDLRVPLWEGTEFTLLKGSVARVMSFRNRRLQMELLRGSVLNQVAPLQEGERYAIEANRHVVNVVGTRFSVSLSESKHASVDLREGKVVVTRDGTPVASLVAPASWHEEGPAVTTQVPSLQLIATEKSLLDDGSDTPRERAVARPTEPRSRGAEQGSVAPKAVQHLMARAAPLLRKCHEAAKRTQPDLPDRVELELTLGPDAHVTAVQVLAQGRQLPEAFVACLRGHALKWYLPMTVAGPATIRVPVQFATIPPP